MTVDYLTEGQACMRLLAQERFEPEKPLLIASCDTAVVYDDEKFKKLSNNPDIDCLVWTFRNHPHANRNPKQYGWVETDEKGAAKGISCKIPIHEDVKNDPGIIGMFWFKKAKYFVEAANAMIAANHRINNEFYADVAIEWLVK